MITVTHFQRKPGERNFSIERLFRDVRAALPADIDCDVHTAPFLSRGVLPRLRSIRAARRNQRGVNHITGDVHFLALGLDPARTILSVMDCGPLHRLRGWRRAVLKFFWFTWPLSRVRMVTTISEATRQELIELTGVSPAKVKVVHCCVSPEFTWRPAEFNVQRPRVLLLGTAPNKNLERMAAALAGLPCLVELIGKPSAAQAAAFAQNDIELQAHGDVSDADILAAYIRCDLVLFASTHEGFGLPIVEGQAIGRPVVTSNCSSMAEVAADSACLVDPWAIDSIRAGVLRVVRDSGYREELLCRGRKNVARFSAGHIAENYAALYREIAVESRGGRRVASPL